MAEWFRISRDDSITTVGAHVTSEINTLHNQMTNLWEDSDLVIVDGIVTINVDTDNIMGVRFVIASEDHSTVDFTDTFPQENSPQIWYSWFVGKGSHIFRIRSAKSIPPQYTFFITTWKESGPAAATNVLTAARLYVQKK